jgi:hypothetical protein
VRPLFVLGYIQLTLSQRISGIIKRRNKERTAKAIKLAKKEAMGDFSHLKNKKGEFIQQPLPQPTLPNISIDDDLADIALQKRAGTPSTTYTAGERQYVADAKYDYATMPAYNAPYSHVQDPMAYARYNPSVPSLPDDGKYLEDDYGSTAHLALAAESYGQNDQSAQHHGSQDYAGDPYDIYTGYATNDQFDTGHRQYGHQPGQYPHSAPDDVAYDGQAYAEQTWNQHGLDGRFQAV